MEKKKVLIGILVVLLVIAIVLIVAGAIVWIPRNQSTETNDITSSIQESEENIQNMEEKEQIKIIKQEDGAYFNVTIHNDSQTEVESGDYEVKVMDKEGKILLTTFTTVDSIHSGEEVNVQIAVDQDFSNADHYVVEKLVEEVK